MPPNDFVLNVPNNKNHKAYTKPKLKIGVNFTASNEWLDIHETADTINVDMSPDIASEFIENISNLLDGENDYAMHGCGSDKKEHCIWFW